MKNGNILISKNDYSINGVKILTKDKKYTMFNSHDIAITSDIENNLFYYSDTISEEDNKGYGSQYIWDYFYTPEEIRKLKLKSI
jgi:hypothetical protein